MPISASCPQCGKTYQVKDDFAGKKFRCKACQGVVSVPASQAASGDPWDQLDLGSFQDQEAGAEDDFGAPAPRRRPSGRKKSKSRGGGMPVTVIVALVFESILLLLKGLGLVGSVMTLDPCSGIVNLVGVVLCGGAIFGYIQRVNVIRWISVVLSGIGILFYLSCGGFFALGGLAVMKDADIPQEQLAMFQGVMGIMVVVMFAVVVLYGVLLGCLVSPSAGDYFDR